MFWKKYSDDSKFKDYVADDVPALANEVRTGTNQSSPATTIDHGIH
jgi:hypothetical protein